MRAFWTGAAILFALLVQTALTRLFPEHARMVDPFLIVVVYCGLTGGEGHGMLAGAAAGWVQDVHFGGRVLGLSGLTRTLVGFAIGFATTRFNLAEPGPRILVLMAATVADALVLGGLAGVFEVPAYELSPLGLLLRAALNAFLGILVFTVVDRQVRRFATP